MPIQTQFPTTFVGPTYILGPFRFSLTQSAPLTTSYTEAGAKGSLTLVDTDNRLSISNGVLVANGGATSPWPASPRLYSSVPIARLAGRALLCKTRRNSGDGPLIGLTATPLRTDPYQAEHMLWLYSGGEFIPSNNMWFYSGEVESAATDYDIALILRSTGAFYLVKGGSYSVWTLLWVGNTVSSANLSVIIATDGAVYTLDDLRVTDLGGAWINDYGIALARSTFSATNGTALTALTPENGGMWNAIDGVFAVQTNRVQLTTLGTSPDFRARAVATTTGADVLAEVTIIGTTSNSLPGLIVRYTDDNNYWLLLGGSGVWTLYEVVAGIFTSRASGGSFSGNVSYRVVVLCVGSTIIAHVNNVKIATYSIATSGQAASKFGIYDGATNLANISSFDEFIVWPRTVSLPAGV